MNVKRSNPSPIGPGAFVPPKGAPNVPPSSPTIPDMGSPVHLVASYRRQPWIGSLAMAWARPISTRPRCGSPTRAVDQRPQIIIRLDLASFASKQLGEQEVAAGRLLDTHEPRTAQTCGAMSSRPLRSRSLDSHSRSLRHCKVTSTGSALTCERTRARRSKRASPNTNASAAGNHARAPPSIAIQQLRA